MKKITFALLISLSGCSGFYLGHGDTMADAPTVCLIEEYASDVCNALMNNGQWTDECQEDYSDSCMDIAGEYELEVDYDINSEVSQ